MGAECCCCSKNEVKPVIHKYEVPRVNSSPMRRESSAMQRFNKVGISTINPLTLINGYLDEPLVSLEEALKPFDGKIHQLSYYIKEAKTKCRYPSEHHLTRDESAAIYIYTMKSGDGGLYDRLQDAWKSADPSKLKPWFKYLKLFKTALDKLPNAKTEVWQGTTFNENLKEQLESTSSSFYCSMGSGSPSEQELKAYLELYGGSKMILIGYDSIDGKVVTGYTAGKSKEVMMWPGTKLGKAKKMEIDANGSVTVHFVGQTTRPKSIKPLIMEEKKHFVCANSSCNNCCRGNHETHHCYGFAFLSHTCQHHCGPTHQCFRCNKYISDLRECNKCQSRYCEKCCLK